MRRRFNFDDRQVKEVRAFYAVPLGAMLMFSTFVYFGYRNRFQPSVHKRLMWFATMSLLDAGSTACRSLVQLRSLGYRIEPPNPHHPNSAQGQ